MNNKKIDVVPKRIMVVDKNTLDRRVFESIGQAAKFIGVTNQYLGLSLRKDLQYSNDNYIATYYKYKVGA